MNREEMEHRPEASLDPAASTSAHNARLDLHDSQSDSPLGLVDAVAASALSAPALARYHAYKEVLLARERDEAAIVSTLTLFVWDLSDSRQ